MEQLKLGYTTKQWLEMERFWVFCYDDKKPDSIFDVEENWQKQHRDSFDDILRLAEKIIKSKDLEYQPFIMEMVRKFIVGIGS